MRLFLFAILCICCALSAAAQTMKPGTISAIRTGWNDDSFAVVTTEPIVNPAHCREPDGYVSMRTLPGYSTYLAAALTAYVARAPVVVTVDDKECAGTRPKLIGINLGK